MLGYGVGPKDIHFVISSGAQKVPITQKITAALKNLGYVVNLVTPEKEAQLAFKSVMPAAYENRAFVVDIGSGNTKVSWMEGGAVKGIETHGSKYYQTASLTDDVVYKDVRQKVNNIPADKRNACFIIGGVPFELAKEIRNGKERFTVLNAPTAYSPKEAKTKAGVNIYKAIADATGTKQFVFDWDANYTIGFLLNLPH